MILTDTTLSYKCHGFIMQRLYTNKGISKNDDHGRCDGVIDCFRLHHVTLHWLVLESHVYKTSQKTMCCLFFGECLSE